MARSIGGYVEEALGRTLEYWREWVRYLSIPLEWQEAVIRSAITLKLCQYEDSGAIIAAMTTSIPEAPGSPRNWDYRYCWLRDAAFVVRALNRLGATRSMEEFLRYIFNIATHDGTLQPLYGIGFEEQLEEHEIESLAGYRGMGPVRRGNLALDPEAARRLWQRGAGLDPAVLRPAPWSIRATRTPSPGWSHWANAASPCTTCRTQGCGSSAAAQRSTPTPRRCAGPPATAWPRSRCGSAGRSRRLLARARGRDPRDDAGPRAQRAQSGQFSASFQSDYLDASLLLLADIGFIAADDPRYVATVEAIGRELRHGDGVFRYVAPDDFGTPETSFTICTFWYIDALAAIGRMDEARELFERVLARRNPLGLLSEDMAFEDGEGWGNFPQTYSHVGLIIAAMRLSRLAGRLVSRLVVVSNRVSLPGEHRAGGLAVALQAALGERGGMWFGWSGKTVRGASGETHEQREGDIRYVTLDLNRTDLDGYYNGFSNRTLWPLLHFHMDLGRLRPRHARGLSPGQRTVRRQAGAAAARGRHGLGPRLPPDPAGFDAAYARHRLPDRLLPARADAFGRPADGDARPRAADVHAVCLRPARLPDPARQRPLPVVRAPVRGGRVLDDDVVEAPDGRRFRTGAFPISIDTRHIARQATAAMAKPAVRDLRASMERRMLAIGVDRLDYSKGLPERFHGFERYLQRHPDQRGSLTYLQIAPITRGEVDEYQQLRSQLEQIAGHINGGHAEPEWTPLRYVNRNFPHATLTGFYRSARVGMVTPLRDGMNPAGPRNTWPRRTRRIPACWCCRCWPARRRK